jgi:ATP-dependent Lon protease
MMSQRAGSVQHDSDKQMYKGYMEQGSFSRGDDKGTLSADAGIVFNGNLDGDIETTARISHLLTALPEAVRNDMAFHDRWHAYLPGWEMPKMQKDYFTAHSNSPDYLSKLPTANRRRNYTDKYDLYGPAPKSVTAKPLPGLFLDGEAIHRTCALKR